MVGDLLNYPALADVNTSTTVGGSLGLGAQIGIEYQSVKTGGFYRCYAFWAGGSGRTRHLYQLDRYE